MIEIEEGLANNYKFVLKTESGQPLLQSVTYPNRKTVQDAIRFLKTSSVHKFERKTNHNGKFLFSLKGNKGEVLGNSQLYNSEAGMENGIKNFIYSINALSE